MSEAPAMMNRTQTFSSPYGHSPDAAVMAGDSGVQHALVLDAVKRYFQDPFESNMDLRGHVFEVLVHDDGLHVTIRHLNGHGDE